MPSTNTPTTLSNLAVIRGEVAGHPQPRELPGGGIVVQFDVTTTVAVGERQLTVSVPIAWNDPAPTRFDAIAPGVEVVVVGTVRRRFFRVAGATQSRTEVVADTVVPARRRKQVVAALSETAARLTAASAT